MPFGAWYKCAVWKKESPRLVMALNDESKGMQSKTERSSVVDRTRERGGGGRGQTHLQETLNLWRDAEATNELRSRGAFLVRRSAVALLLAAAAFESGGCDPVHPPSSHVSLSWPV